MKVTIWDMDYYYAKEKVNCFNADVMKIASYHKQLGDQINFVTCEDDIFRPYEKYYIIKNNDKLPHPPLEFFTNKRVLWWGKAYRARIKWTMSDAMLACRPDYLLYPEYNTALERAEHVRFFNNNAEPLKLVQDWHNKFKRKVVLVTDPFFWCATPENIIWALKELSESRNVGFLEPIWIQKIISNEEIKKLFFNLKLSRNVKLDWTTVKKKDVYAVLEFLRELKQHHPRVKVDNITIDYHSKDSNHWVSREAALKDFEDLQQIIIEAKRLKMQVVIKMPTTRFETPYFALFETLSHWTQKYPSLSWLEYLALRYGGRRLYDLNEYCCHPEQWHELFRDFLRQTYKYQDFLLYQWGTQKLAAITVPWLLLEEEFKYGI